MGERRIKNRRRSRRSLARQYVVTEETYHLAGFGYPRTPEEENDFWIIAYEIGRLGFDEMLPLLTDEERREFAARRAELDAEAHWDALQWPPVGSARRKKIDDMIAKMRAVAAAET